MKAENKWDKEEDYIFLKKWIECNLKTDENLGIDKAIYEKLPKVIMQENKSELIDLSFINLSNLSFGKCGWDIIYPMQIYRVQNF